MYFFQATSTRKWIPAALTAGKNATQEFLFATEVSEKSPQWPLLASGRDQNEEYLVSQKNAHSKTYCSPPLLLCACIACARARNPDRDAPAQPANVPPLPPQLPARRQKVDISRHTHWIARKDKRDDMRLDETVSV
jgi:hypothetical protein